MLAMAENDFEFENMEVGEEPVHIDGDLCRNLLLADERLRRKFIEGGGQVWGRHMQEIVDVYPDEHRVTIFAFLYDRHSDSMTEATRGSILDLIERKAEEIRNPVAPVELAA